ncbi:MAG: folP [Candidatus Saccharibacteria bacterium]|nr:folP [Candidatus Saccharibacteria bacterium]
MVKLVGVLNVTPDSFSDGGQFITPAAAIAQAEKLFADGAELVDVGAESTRPGAVALTPEQEWGRLKAILPVLMKQFPGKISLDTYHPITAHKALKQGKVIINDVTGLTNPAMIGVIAEFQADCIISHLPTTEVQAAHSGELVDDIQVVVDDLYARAHILQAEGLDQDQIILDPGIGFGKAPELNWQLLEFARYMPDYQVMIGYSRKRFLGEHRMELEPNLEAGRVAIAAGAAYLRVHDVAGHQQLLY